MKTLHKGVTYGFLILAVGVVLIWAAGGFDSKPLAELWAAASADTKLICLSIIFAGVMAS